MLGPRAARVADPDQMSVDPRAFGPFRDRRAPRKADAPRRRCWGRAAAPRADRAAHDAPSKTEARKLALQCPWLANVPYVSAAGDLGRTAAVVAKHYRGEFCWSSSFDPSFVAALMSHGFLTMAQRVGRDGYALLPKMHRHRCVLDLNDVHTARTTRRRSHRFRLTVDRAFDAVVRGVADQHGDECWFYPPLVKAFREIYAAGRRFDEGSGAAPAARMRSFECWDEATGELVAGELGYAVGDVYTSLSGFSKAPSAGSVQCAATARVLRRSGFALWDLGMELPYKVAMGAALLPRDAFLERLGAARARGYLPLDPRCVAGRTRCRDLIDEVLDIDVVRVVTPAHSDDSASNASSDSPAAAARAF